MRDAELIDVAVEGIGDASLTCCPVPTGLELSEMAAVSLIWAIRRWLLGRASFIGADDMASAAGPRRGRCTPGRYHLQLEYCGRIQLRYIRHRDHLH